MAFATVSLAVEGPWRGQFRGGPLLCGRAFQVHPSGGTQWPAVSEDIGCQALWPALPKRGIQQDQVVDPGLVPEKVKGIPVGQTAGVQAAQLEIAQKTLAVPGIFLGKMHHAGAPGPGLQTQGSAPGKKIEDGCARKMGAKPVEKALADDARGGADAAVSRGPELASPAAPGNDPDAQVFLPPRSCGLFPAALRGIMG